MLWFLFCVFLSAYIIVASIDCQMDYAKHLFGRRNMLGITYLTKTIIAFVCSPIIFILIMMYELAQMIPLTIEWLFSRPEE